MKTLILGLVVETMIVGGIAFRVSPTFNETIRFTLSFFEQTVQSL